MDPSLTLRTWRHAVKEGLEEEAYEAAAALVDWLDRGGYRPRGLREDELRALYADARAGRGLSAGSKRHTSASASSYGKLHRTKTVAGIQFHFVLHAVAAKRSGWTNLDDGKRRTVRERAFYKKVRAAVAERLGTKFGGAIVRRIFIYAPAIGWKGWGSHVDILQLDVDKAAGHTVGFQYDPAFIEEPWVKQAVARAKWKTARKRVAARREEDRWAVIEPVPMKRPVKGYR